LGCEQYDGRLCCLAQVPVAVLTSADARRGSTLGLGVSPVSTVPPRFVHKSVHKYGGWAADDPDHGSVDHRLDDFIFQILTSLSK
jgi:hypothetical protein